MYLSIIIPVFNAQNTLKRCLDSVLHQNISNFQVILVNDGSTDDSLSIIQKYCSDYSNFEYVNQKNKGVSEARNIAIEKAIGTHILFLDADDELFKDQLKSIYDFVIEQDLDLLYLKLILIDNFDNRFLREYAMNNKSLEVMTGLKHQRAGFIAAIYKRNTIGELRFKKDLIIAEDAYFNLHIHLRSERVSYWDGDVYKYYQNTKSILDVNITDDDDRKERIYSSNMNLLKYLLFDYHNARNKEHKEYIKRPIFMTIKMIFDTYIIPNDSSDTYSKIMNIIKQNNLLSNIPELKKNISFIGMNFIIFSLLTRIKNYIKYKLNVSK